MEIFTLELKRGLYSTDCRSGWEYLRLGQAFEKFEEHSSLFIHTGVSLESRRPLPTQEILCRCSPTFPFHRRNLNMQPLGKCVRLEELRRHPGQLISSCFRFPQTTLQTTLFVLCFRRPTRPTASFDSSPFLAA